MPRLEMVDIANIPTYYIDTAIPEHAGDGNVRIWNCVTRNDLLIPRCEIIIHSTKLIVAARTVTEMAQQVFNNDQVAGMLSLIH